MAESSEDIESGSHRLISPLCGEKETSLDKKLRNLAFELALIEKAATTLGTMNFIWATVVLLGGFSQSLKSIDFWFVSVMLVVEGLRILCRQGELEWSPHSRLTLIITVYSLVIQELSLFACMYLSVTRILKQDYGSGDNMNRNLALNLFYGLSIVESNLTLLGFLARLDLSPPAESPKQSTSIIFRKLFSIWVDFPGKFIFSCAVGQKWSCALEDDGFDHSQSNTVLRYLYDTYCRCMNGSVFDGLKMDFLSYSVELLQSIDDVKLQLEGARLLSMLLKSDRLRSEKLGTTAGVLERLIELLNWEKPQEQEIRIAAGEIICKLVEIPRNGIRVMAIPESMQSINSLVYDTNHSGIHRTKYQGLSSDEYNYSYFSVLGKRMLKILANDSDNRAKIGTNKGLLRKIIELENLNANASESEIISHLESLPMETLALRDVRGCEAEHSDDPNLQSV